MCAHPHPHRLRPGPGVAGREVMGVFPSLILFFCLPPTCPLPPPSKRKKEKKTQIKCLSGTIPLAQAASVCFVLPPSLPGLPQVWTLGPQLHDLFTPSPLSSLLSHLILFAFIASLHHDHNRLWAVRPRRASTELPDLTAPRLWDPWYLGLKAFDLFAPSFTVNPSPVWFGAGSLTWVRH